MKIDIWSDIACPFCYIGTTQLQAAIKKFAHGSEVELAYHSFELDPQAPKTANETMAEMLARKKGIPAEQVESLLDNVTQSAADTGLTFHVDKAKIVSTFDGHRLVHFAAEHGKAGEAINALYKAYFTDGKDVADHEVLVAIAKDVGLDEKAAKKALKADTYAQDVKADIQQAADYGIRGVPFIIVDGKYGISGAQGEATFSQALAKIWHEKNPLKMVGSEAAEMCQDGVCL